MKAVMMSIQPKWCELIASGQKTIEVRKTKPKLETPFKCYIYCTKPKMHLVDVIRDGEDVYGEIYHGETKFIKVAESSTYGTMCWKYQKVIGEFVCDNISEIFVVCDVHDELPSRPCEYWLDWESDIDDVPKEACLSAKEIMSYLGKQYNSYTWHISDLVIYYGPKELSEFHLPCNSECDGCCEYGCARMLKRPPQSWCYVEELR